MCPIAHVPHHPCALFPRCSIFLCSIKQDTCSGYMSHVTHFPCVPSSMCLITLVPHLEPCIVKQHTCSGYMSHVPVYPHLHPQPVSSGGGLSNVSNCQKDVKLSKRCQMDTILTSNMMVTKNPQNLHRKYF